MCGPYRMLRQDWHLGGKVVMTRHTRRPNLIEPASSPFPALRPLEATMKKILLLTGVLLALTASFASAAPGLDMSWGGCPVTLSNPTDVADPCVDDGGLYFFYMAFKSPAGLSKVVSETFLVDVQTPAPSLPDWWHVETANPSLGTPDGCRAGSFAFSTTRNFVSTTVCKDYWGSSAQPGSALWYPGTGGAGRSRLVGVFSRSSASAGALTADIEYFAGSGFFDTNHATAANGICQGCQTPSCIVWNYLLLQQPAGTPNGDIVTTDENVRRFMTWQGSGGQDCPA